MIIQSTKEKILNYIIKSASRFNSIKQLNLPLTIVSHTYKPSRERYESPTHPTKDKTIDSRRSHDSQKSGDEEPNRVVQELSDMVSNRIRDKRDLMKEIV